MDLGMVRPGTSRAGSPSGFLAPERLQARDPDPRSDLYSLGAVLYFALAGHGPLEAQTRVGGLFQAQRSEPTPLASVRPQLPSELATLVDRLLARDPAQRPGSVAEFADALREFAGTSSGDSEVPLASQTVTNLPGEVAPILLASETGTSLADENPAPAVGVPVASETMTPIRGNSPVSPPMALETDEDAPAQPAAWVYPMGDSPPAPYTPPIGTHTEDDPFAMHQMVGDHAEPSPRAIRRTQEKEGSRGNTRLWVAVGLGLHVTAMVILVLFCMGVFNRDPEPASRDNPTQEQREKRPNHPGYAN